MLAAPGRVRAVRRLIQAAKTSNGHRVPQRTFTRYTRSLTTKKSSQLGSLSTRQWIVQRGYATGGISPTSRYSELVESETLRPDEHQRMIITKLQKLHDELRGYTQPPVPHTGAESANIFSRFFRPAPASAALKPPENAPKGLYLYGDVGTGKSMLMDLFYDTLPPNITRKRRVHFHAFMIEVHKAVHNLKSSGVALEDPILPVAEKLARDVTVLCFDEFQVTDIVDAMILRRLMELLVNYGVIMVMTSNRHPDDLYKNGIQRISFLPTIELLKDELLVTDLNSPTDYRKIPRALSNVYFSPISVEHRSEFDKLFFALASGPSFASGTSPSASITQDRMLPVWGRELRIPESSEERGGVARFTFDDLCGKPLSAADYIELTNTFGTIFVGDVPKLSMGQKDKARRFITFVDACYESKTKLFTLSEVPIFEIFSDEKTGEHISDHMRSVMDDLGLPSHVVGASSIFTGEEEVFAFARACSRLVQMGSKEWAETLHHEQ